MPALMIAGALGVAAIIGLVVIIKREREAPRPELVVEPVKPVIDAPAVIAIADASVDAAVATDQDVLADVGVLARKRDSFVACHKKRDALISMTIAINTEGGVDRAVFDGHDPKTQSCLIAAAFAIKFAAGPARTVPYVIEIKAKKPSPSQAGATASVAEPQQAQTPPPADPPRPDPTAMSRYRAKFFEEMKIRANSYSVCQNPAKPIRSVTIRFTVLESGAVDQVSIPNDVPMTMQNCLRAKLFSERFPKPPEALTLNVPIVFPKSPSAD